MLTARTLLLLAAASTGCSRKTPAPTTADSTVTAAPPVELGWRLTVDPASATSIDLGGPGTVARGETKAAMGSLEVTPSDLGRSRGGVMIDLSTLALSGADGGTDDDKWTKGARASLELFVAPDKPHPRHRWADFALRSIDGLSATDLTRIVPTKEGGEDVRTVTMTAHGDLMIHGYKIDRSAPLRVTFRHPAGASMETPPTRVEVVTLEPVRISLAEVDARPRTSPGTKRSDAGAARAASTSGPGLFPVYANVSLRLQLVPAH